MTVASSDQFGKSHARLIERLYAQAEAARWALSLDEFRDVLHRSVSARFGAETPSDTNVESYLGSLFVEDLALAAACERGTQSAWVDSSVASAPCSSVPR